MLRCYRDTSLVPHYAAFASAHRKIFSFFLGHVKDIVSSQKNGVMIEEQIYQW